MAIYRRIMTILLAGIWLFGATLSPASAADLPVRAVMFYSPSCGHCHYVIENVITPLLQEYEEQFEIVGVNVAEEGGQALYQAAITQYAIPDGRRGVPTLIIGDTVLVGSVEIPEQLPGLVASHLEKGGVDWPAIPGLLEALALSETEPAGTATPAETAPAATAEAGIGEESAPGSDPSVAPETDPEAAPEGEADAEAPDAEATLSVPTIPGVEEEDWRDRFARDPLGNGISVAVLAGMLVSAVYQGWKLIYMGRGTPAKSDAHRRAEPESWRWAVPVLVVVGLIVAGYLAYVETQHVPAVCGPVGDCNTVQQSEYALLLGFVPIAVFGVLGYLAIGAAWAAARWAPSPWAEAARVAMSAMAWFGVGFSIYLTFLEPFVIGATCAWCLTSAVLMTGLFWLVAPLGLPAWRSLWGTGQSSLLTKSREPG